MRTELDVLRDLEKLVIADGVYWCDEAHYNSHECQALFEELRAIRAEAAARADAPGDLTT